MDNNQQFQQMILEQMTKSTDQVMKMGERVTKLEKDTINKQDLAELKRQMVTKAEVASLQGGIDVPCEHQDVLGELFFQLKAFLRSKPLKVYMAPFDVVMAAEGGATETIQPDIVVCDKSLVDNNGCHGIPELVMEILSPATIATDYISKMASYEQIGVKEYWLIHPIDKIVMVFTLGQNKQYGKPGIYYKTGEVKVGPLKDLVISLDEVFGSDD